VLSKPYRFHGFGSLNSTYRHGASVRGSLISLKYAPRKPGQNYRVAVVVSRKVSKSAVTRNRIRRRVYEAVRQSPKTPQALNLVFVVYNDRLAELPSKEVAAAVDQLLDKLPNGQKTVA
jgi:ribonuclease P protein component